MGELADRVRACADHLRARGVGTPAAAFVFGSGLSNALPFDADVSLPFDEIPGFPQGSVKGHARRLEFGRVGESPCLVLRGRVHAYEGVDVALTTFPIRVACALGAKWIALTNASGALRPLYDAGDVVAITDHLNLTGESPLSGPNDDALGTRFPDLGSAYDPKLVALAEDAAREESLLLRRGVYAAVPGPQFETPAELRMLRALGADLVGMSTVPETIVAVHGKMRVLGLSVVTDLAFPEAPAALAHADVVAVAEKSAPHVTRILEGVLRRKP